MIMTIKLNSLAKPSMGSETSDTPRVLKIFSPWILALAVKYLVLVLVLSIGLLVMDPNYFDFPLGEGEMGMPKDRAPNNSFGTEMTFDATKGYAIQMSLKAKDNSFPASLEVYDPFGARIYSHGLFLSHSAGSPEKVEWTKIMTPAPYDGTYRLRITQDTFGLTKVYLYQGPFVHRLIAIPIVAAILLLIIDRVFRGRRATQES